MNGIRTCGLVCAGLLLASAAQGGVGDTIFITFNEVTDLDIRDDSTPPGGPVSQGPGNPPGFIHSPMVTLGGAAHYQGPWEVMVAWNPAPTNGPGWELFEVGGTGTITLDQVPPLPPGEYYVYLSFNVANWANGSPVGIQLSGTGVTEIGNELPREMHFVYPESNPGFADTLSNVEIAGPHMGTNAQHLVYSDGSPVILESCLDLPFCETPIPTGNGLGPAGTGGLPFEDGNSFATSVFIEPGNQLVLSILDGADVGYSHLRGYSMIFSNVAPFVVQSSNATVQAARANFATADGLLYELQRSSDPAADAWADTGVVLAGNGSEMHFFDPVGPDGAGLYRVVLNEE